MRNVDRVERMEESVATNQAEPASTSVERLESAAEVPARAPDAGARTVFIVDDDAAARLALSCLLADWGCRIVLATSADDARRRLDSVQPDVIVCDLVMPGTNGDQFCRWLKLHPIWRYVPVIAVTQLDDTLVVEALLEAGADDVIVKPAKGRELQARVAAAVRTRDRYLDLLARHI